MRLTGVQDSTTHTVRIDFETNCYTDGVPLVDKAIFYNVDFELESPAFPLAAALLFRRYCGETLEFAGAGLSIDMIEALRELLPQVRGIAPIDGNRRHNFLPGVEVLCSELTDSPMPTVTPSPSTLQLTSVTWSGDFPRTPNRTNPARRGQIFTNAALIAENSTIASIVIGLLSAGTRLGKLHIPASASVPDATAIIGALRAVGIQLKFVP